MGFRIAPAQEGRTSIMSSSNYIAGSIGDIDDYEPIEAECPGCGEYLDLHQPMEDRPEELLGVCPDCNQWHIVVSGTDGGVELVIKIMKGELIAAARQVNRVSKRPA